MVSSASTEVVSFLKFGDEQRLAFVCPGCSHLHAVPVVEKRPQSGVRHPNAWDWNGSFEEPTLHPSLLITAGQLRCHLYVEEGCAVFLGDCSHNNSNMRIPLPRVADSWLVRKAAD